MTGEFQTGPNSAHIKFVLTWSTRADHAARWLDARIAFRVIEADDFAAMAERSERASPPDCIRGNAPADARPRSRASFVRALAASPLAASSSTSSAKATPSERRSTRYSASYAGTCSPRSSSTRSSSSFRPPRRRAMRSRSTRTRRRAGSAAGFRRRQAPRTPRTSSRVSERANRARTVTRAGSARSPVAARDASPCLAIAHDSRERRSARSSDTARFTRMTGGEQQQTATGPRRSAAAATHSGSPTPRSRRSSPSTKPALSSCAPASGRRAISPQARSPN